jgi:enoyl-CoA hydratase/carnithine racemase
VTFEDIKTEIIAPIARIVIDRGEGRNALRPQTLQEIAAAMEELSSNPAVKAIVLTGAGKHFSAGADFSFLQKLTTMSAMDIRDQIYTAFQGAARRIYDCPKPTLAVINGAAITVGCELALACDFRLVSPTAQFQESWIKLGLMPPLGGLFLLPRIVGLGRACEIVLAARPIDAQEAVRIGLATELIDPADRLTERSMEFAAQLAALPPLAYRAVKEGLHRGLDSNMENEWATNVMAQSLLLGTEDFREGLAAVLEKRPGRFKGA